MRFVGDIALDAEVRAIASGAITDGAPVVVNADGTVSLAGTQSSAVGASINLTSGGTRTDFTSVSYDSNSNRYVAFFRDYGNSNYGTATVASVSGTTTTVGSSVVFVSGEVRHIQSTFDSNSNRVVVAYRNDASGDNGFAAVGSVDPSDNSISFGTPVAFNSGSSSTNEITITFDNNSNKVVIAYQDGGNSNAGTAIVGTVDPSDNSISFGSEAVFDSDSTSGTGSTFDSSNNKVVIVYRDNGNSSYGTAVVATVSGTSISFGTPVVYESANCSENVASFDTSNNKVVIAYRDTSTADNYGTGIVGTVSSTSISFGTAVVFNTASTNNMDIAFSTQLNKTLIVYQDGGTVVNGILGTVSGTSISFGSEISLSGASSGSTSSGQRIENGIDFNTTDSNFLIVSSPADGSSSGQVFAHTSEFDPLTSENFIGFAHAAYADGQKATVKTTGSIARNIPQQASASSTVGTAVVFESANANFESATFDSNSNKVVIAYRDIGGSEYGTAVVGTVSGTSVSFGTPVVFESASSRLFSATFDSSNNKVVIAYRDDGNSQYGTAIVGTVSGTSISFGSPTVFESAVVTTISATFDSSNNKVVIAYTDDGNSAYGTAIVGTVSGTSISFGSAAVFESAETNSISATFDSSNNKVVIAYADVGNSTHGTAIVGTVSGTSISFGSASVFESASSQQISTTFDSSANKVVIAYQDQGNSNHGTAILGTVSGTSISFGSPTVFNAGGTEDTSPIYDSNAQKVVIGYRDGGNSDYGTFILGTVSGTSISFNSEVVFESANTDFVSTTFDSNANKVVIAYQDVGNSGYGTAVAIATAGSPEDLTIGQQYFVQTDGSLGTSADDPSVIAGTAIGASDLIVKG